MFTTNILKIYYQLIFWILHMWRKHLLVIIIHLFSLYTKISLILYIHQWELILWPHICKTKRNNSSKRNDVLFFLCKVFYLNWVIEHGFFCTYISIENTISSNSWGNQVLILQNCKLFLSLFVMISFVCNLN